MSGLKVKLAGFALAVVGVFTMALIDGTAGMVVLCIGLSAAVSAFD